MFNIDLVIHADKIVRQWKTDAFSDNGLCMTWPYALGIEPKTLDPLADDIYPAQSILLLGENETYADKQKYIRTIEENKHS